MRVNQPNLFLIGAPKSGTTAIYTYLASHPQIYFPRDKEPHFYAEDFPSHRTCVTREDYDKLYAATEPETRFIGDASVLMLYSKTAVQRVLADCPDARFVVAVRNPAELVVSLHRQFVLSGRERDLEFASAWQREMECAHRVTNNRVLASCDATSALLHYPRYGRLGTQIAKILTQVERQRVHVLLLDDVQTRPREVYLRLLDFLELKDDGRETFPRINEGREHRWPWLAQVIQSRPWLTRLFKQAGISATLRRWGTRPAVRTSLPLELQRQLREYFADEVILLAEQIGRDLSQWHAGAENEV